MMRTLPMSEFTHLHLAQLFVSLLAIALSQKEHWIGMIFEPKGRGCCSVGKESPGCNCQAASPAWQITYFRSDIADTTTRVRLGNSFPFPSGK